ncbi:MAG: TonB-dependent receptor [Bacteroidetes bacterium]|nr:TonB-dependent receptor [Bacteroidota bacterium]
MKHLLLVLPLVLVFLQHSLGQTVISGKVTDRKGEPLFGASIAIKGSYDGATSDSLGHFSFRTRKKDSVTISASYLGYEPEFQTLVLKGGNLDLHFKLKDAFNELNAVTITAGIFEASDSKRMVMLRPMDIVTTAGAGADITAVMQLLPGSNRVGEQEGLFVRGGAAYETKTVIDGMIVQNPFFSSTPDVPQRGRFTPFMFKGMAFSTGGYSAQYGQALSSVLLLDTQDKVSDQSSTNIVAHLAGVGIGYTHKGAISGQLYYSNLAPFLKLVKTNIDFVKPPQGMGGSLTLNENLSKNSVLKMYVTYSDGGNTLGLPNYDDGGKIYQFKLRNRNLFTNNTYKVFFDEGKWIWQSGFSYSNNIDDITIGTTPGDRRDERSQVRSVLKRLWGKNQENSVLAGLEYHNIRNSNLFDTYKASLEENYSAAFAETEFYLLTKLALRVGLRGEYTSILDRYNASPRFSAAYKTSQYSQVSFAMGQFYQTPEKNYLYTNRSLGYELANHFILNYQWSKSDRTFRVEAFDKEYKNLVREYQTTFDPNPYRFPTGATDNSGFGNAYGFDVFFRDKKTVRLGDFWVTYSYLNTSRLFQNYPVEAAPIFSTTHNFSVVYKQFIPKISSNVGITYTYTSGRPYYDAASPVFLGDRTKSFQNVSIAASHIRSIKGSWLVFFMTLDNVLGRKNEFGFRYSSDGQSRFPVIPVTYRTLFFGVSMNISRHADVPKESKLDL